MRATVGGELFLAPLGPNPERILDLGTGTGNWVIHMAEYDALILY